MTPKIPLSLKIRNKKQREIAYAQDILIEELYATIPDAILHGGTAIWRCYNGNRFSEDVDVYLLKDEESIERFFQALEKKGFSISKKRIKENSIYSDLSLNGVPLRFEATFQSKKSIIKRYETSESFFINVSTLSPDILVEEKIAAYLKRRKIRDLYDIYFLLEYAEEREKTKEKVKLFLDHFEDPLDEADLGAIILSGVAPNAKQLLEGIKRWEK